MNNSVLQRVINVILVKGAPDHFILKLQETVALKIYFRSLLD